MSDERENQELQLQQMNEYIILVTLTVLYREVQLDFAHETEALYMQFERCYTTNIKRYSKQHIKYFNFLSKVQLDHPVLTVSSL